MEWKRIVRLRLKLLLLLVIAASTLWREVHCLQPSSSSDSSSSIRRRMVVPSWEDFSFAPNGVCVSPARFVVVNNDSNSNPVVVDDDNDAETPAATLQQFTMRNVPGTGDCMFQAVALASFASVGLGGNNALLRAITKELRDLTARVLEQQGDDDHGQQLVIEGKRLVSASALLQQATRQEGLKSTADYLRLLRLPGADGGLYGGGPELTVLCNLLRRPISIYELAKPKEENVVDHDEKTNSNDAKRKAAANIRTCPIVCQGTFGGPIFQDPLQAVPHSAVTSLSQSHLLPGAYSWHLHILVVETSPTLKHACVLLPQQPDLDEDVTCGDTP